MADRNTGSPLRERGVEASDSNDDVRVAMLFLIRMCILDWRGRALQPIEIRECWVLLNSEGVVFPPLFCVEADLSYDDFADD